MEKFVIETCTQYEGGSTRALECSKEAAEAYVQHLNERGYDEINTLYTLDEWFDKERWPAHQVQEVYEESLASQKRGIWWLTVEDLKDLKETIDKTLSQKAPQLIRVEHLHCTLAFDVPREGCPDGYSIEDGTPYILALGLAYNDKAACLIVNLPGDCNNTHPHVTLALAPGVPPVYCNEMLADSYQFKRLEGVLVGDLEFYEFPNQ